MANTVVFEISFSRNHELNNIPNTGYNIDLNVFPQIVGDFYGINTTSDQPYTDYAENGHWEGYEDEEFNYFYWQTIDHTAWLDADWHDRNTGVIGLSGAIELTELQRHVLSGVNWFSGKAAGSSLINHLDITGTRAYEFIDISLFDGSTPASISLADLQSGGPIFASWSMQISGADGNDTLASGRENDTVSGGKGSDVLAGREGDDSIYDSNTLRDADNAADTLTGGEGIDAFYVDAGGARTTADVVTDFEAGERILVWLGTQAANFADQTVEIGDGAALVANEIQVTQSAAETRFLIGVDNTPGADGEIVLQGDYRTRTFTASGDVIAISEPLFTTKADIVNFGRLLTAQSDAITAMKDDSGLYLALGGDDQVYLPDRPRLPGGHRFYTANGTPFMAGPGNDSVEGGQLDDVVHGGLADDTLVGSPGGDELFGDAGGDVFDFRTGRFASFNGIAAGQHQDLDGGAEEPGTRDEIRLPDGAYDFHIREKGLNLWLTKSPTTVITGPTEFGRVELSTKGIEKAVIDDPFKNPVAVGNLALAAVELSIKAYDPSGLPRTWRPLSAMELGIAPAVKDAGGRVYSLVDGHYFSGLLAHAHVTVSTGLVGGKKTVAIAFAGTDDPLDEDSWIFLTSHYATYKPVIDALKTWIGEVHPDRILVTGHSLGASMAQLLLWEMKSANIEAFTIGSPGARVADIGAANLVNFVHLGDPAYNAGKAVFYKHAGSDVFINRSDLPWGPVEPHYAENYQESIQRLVVLSREDGAFHGTALAAAMREGKPYTGASVEVAPGTSRRDILKALADDDYVLGGDGNDRIEMAKPRMVVASGERLLDGGHPDDVDTLYLPFTERQYRLPASPDAELRVWISGTWHDVGILEDIDRIRFTQSDTIYLFNPDTGHFELAIV